ncbi:hypothetical protein KC357_g114 [Hortaea werneckii]|nr:hypothetical protein KC357_g114 [Hortaea werneckii]
MGVLVAVALPPPIPLPAIEPEVLAIVGVGSLSLIGERSVSTPALFALGGGVWKGSLLVVVVALRLHASNGQDGQCDRLGDCVCRSRGGEWETTALDQVARASTPFAKPWILQSFPNPPAWASVLGFWGGESRTGETDLGIRLAKFERACEGRVGGYLPTPHRGVSGTPTARLPVNHDFIHVGGAAGNICEKLVDRRGKIWIHVLAISQSTWALVAIDVTTTHGYAGTYIVGPS